MAIINPNNIKTHPTFENLFPIKPGLLARIEANMKAGDYDDSQPVIVATWEGQNEEVCIDGHTRIQAAKNAGIEEIPTKTYHFETENKALEYAIHLQANRRNMKDADILKCVMALDQRRLRGGDRRSDEAKSKPQHFGIENSRSASAKYTAELLGISTRQVEKFRTVMDHADPETLEAVETGQMSINKACNATQEKRKAEKVAAEGEEAQPVPSPEGAPEEADSCDEEKGSIEGAGAGDADYDDPDEDTYEDASDEAVDVNEGTPVIEADAPDDDTPEDACVEVVADDVPVTNEGVNSPNMDTTVTISSEQFQALESLGGSVEEHVTLAIAKYLSSKGQSDMYDPKEEKLAKIAADVVYGLAAESDKESEEDEDECDGGYYEGQDLAWAEPVTTGSAAA